MYSNFTNKAFILLTILLALFTLFVLPSVVLTTQAKQPDSLPELKIIPTKCVSLKQGQVCYVNVTVVWQVGDAGDYCLFSSLQSNLLQCWLSSKQGTFSQEVEITDDLIYTLTDTKNEQEIISNRLPLAWVYKKEKFSHSSWRVF
ncbi:DUF3019 domain-containing protein [Pseudoalteromonas tunicata]|uniref:DUF3019 domain-containing protein n=1 Tax=Pseudoalteromonas tunicata TaxID=314281 RepID=UPI00273F43CD|nr:DUF3019 domain-containing protein [Pseudoalteromonas tunicata]MDP5213357.1 DUF3019 domain-containing protein [Pseudoalteromonas tunicata]